MPQWEICVVTDLINRQNAGGSNDPLFHLAYIRPDGVEEEERCNWSVSCLLAEGWEPYQEDMTQCADDSLILIWYFKRPCS